MNVKGLLTAVFFLLLLSLAACTTAAKPVVDALPREDEVQAVATAVPVEVTLPDLILPDLGKAPEILNNVWINSDRPVTLASQRGKVVLLEFWTFG
jgi:hypothetical protein